MKWPNMIKLYKIHLFLMQNFTTSIGQNIQGYRDPSPYAHQRYPFQVCTAGKAQNSKVKIQGKF